MAAGDISAQLQTASKFNAALFDGVDDYVEIPHSPLQLGANLPNGFTISAWINPRSVGEKYGRIIDKSTGITANNGFKFMMDSENRLQASVNSGTGAVTADNAVPYGVWKHALVTFSADSPTSVQIYIDGSASGSAGAGGGSLSGITTTNAMRIGNRPTAIDKAFGGSIRSVKMWNKVLSTAEIAADYAGHNSPREGLILDVPLDKDYNDHSTLGLTGTNSGTILTNNMKNKIIADTKGLNLPAVTDKIIALPLMGRSEVVKIVTAKRATS